MKYQVITINFKRVILFIISIFIVFFMLYYIGFETFINNVSRLKIKYLGAIVLIYTTAWILRATRLNIFVKKLSLNIGYLDVFRINIGSNALNILLPIRLGDISGAIALGKRYALSKSIAALLHTRIMDFIALVIYAIFIIIFFEVPQWTVGAVIFIIIIIGGILLFIVTSNRTSLIDTLISKLADRFSQAIRKFKATPVDGRSFVKNFTVNYEVFLTLKFLIIGICLSLLIWFADVIVCYLVAKGIGYPIEFGIIMAAIVFSNFIKAIPTTPGDIGVFEGSLSVLLIFNGVPAEYAVSIAVIHHLILNTYTLVVGIPGIAKIADYMLDI